MDSTTAPRHSLFAANLPALFGAGFVLLFDVAFDGSYLLSIVVCPVWLLVSLVRSAVNRQPSQVVLFRAAIPVLTLAIALVNTFVQWNIAKKNGEQVVSACESFQAANGRYPKTLEELVPQYLPSIPLAKYCASGQFRYHNSEDHPPILWWSKFGFLHRIYSFDRKQWNELD